MAIHSRHFHEAFSDFSDLFAEATRENIHIDEDAVPLLLGAVACFASPEGEGGHLNEQVRKQAKSSWDEVLQRKQGEIIVQADIWEWIKRWFPDPVEAERIRIRWGSKGIQEINYPTEEI